MKTADQAERLVQAKRTLVLEHPFFGELALGIPHVLSEAVPTAATNGTMALYNPAFLAKLSMPEVVFLVAHECMHPMLEHTTRRENRDPRIWNRAIDYVANYILTQSNVGKMPACGLLSEALYLRGNGQAERIYDFLATDPDSREVQAGIALDDCQSAAEADTPAGRAQQEQTWRVKVAQAAQAARMAGRLPVFLERLVGALLAPKVRWQDVLHRFMARARRQQRSFARPNRRFLPQGLYLPSRSGYQLGEVVFAIDCSGSIADDLTQQFLSEAADVQSDLAPSALHLLSFDTEVHAHASFSPDEPVTFTPVGRGGTDFACIWPWIEKQGIYPVATVVLTDLGCDSFGTCPDYPVLWASTTAGRHPFGEYVPVN